MADVLARLSLTLGLPVMIQVDIGPEFTSKALDECAHCHGVKLELIRPRRPMENALVDSFNASLRKERPNMHWFRTMPEAKREIEAWRRAYSEKRPHRSLGNVIPVEYTQNQKLRTSDAENLALKVV